MDADTQLVERCLGGEEAAWEDLVKVHTRRVYAICYRFTGSDHEAQDLTQDVFLRVFRSLKSFRAGEGSFSVWLSRLSRNLLIDHYRRTKLERASIRSKSSCRCWRKKPRDAAGPTGCWPAGKRARCCKPRCRSFRPDLRETVILRDLEELEYREIAQVLNVPEGTVKSRLNRGRAELARILRKHKGLGGY